MKNAAIVGTVVTLLLFSTGCAQHTQHYHYRVVVPRECITAIELTDASECHYKQGDPNMVCTGLKLTKLKGCEHADAAAAPK